MGKALKVFCVLLALVFTMSVAVTGCGGKESGETGQNQSAGTQTANDSSAEKTEAPEKELKGKIVVGIDQGIVEDGVDPATGSVKKGWGQFFKQFTDKHPGVEIEGIAVPYDGHVAKFQTLLLSDAVDVITLTPYDFYVQGLIMNLTDLVQRDNVMANYVDAAQKASRIYLNDDNIMGLPAYLGVFDVCYDKQIFEDFGVEPLSMNPTPEELQEKLPRLTGKNPRTGEQNYGLYINGKWQSLYALDLLSEGFVLGDDSVYNLLDLSKSKYTLNTPENKQKIEYWLSFLKYCPPGFLVDQGAENWGRENNSVAVMLYTGMGQMQEAINNNLTDRFIATYGMKDDQGRVPYMDTGVWAIAKSTKNLEVAWEFIKFASGYEGQKFDYEVNNTIPAIKNADFINAETTPYMEAFMKSAGPGRHYTFSNFVIQTFRPWLNGLMASTVEGAKIDLDKELADIQSKADTWVKEQKPVELK